ncbi:MAG: DUF402 domain-containing protein [Dehalococcoidia bacterium]|nr:DUF402 domain-containing protein [Dehalococcoidia bacterium]
MTTSEPGEHLVTRQRVRVLSTKYDGSQHYEQHGWLLEAPGGDLDAPDVPLRVLLEAGTELRSYRGTFPAAIDFTMLFWPGQDRWYNVEHNHWVVTRPDGRLSTSSYANVSTPATFDGDTVRWVDLDLDVTVRDGLVELVDEDEFDEHRTRMAYPESVITRAREAASELLRLAVLGAPPFDRDTHIWRPAR